MNAQTGKWIMLAGLLLGIIGLLIYFFHHKLGWLGKLPGDIRVERENFRFYFPFTTMLLLSLAVTLIFNIIKKFF